MKRLAVLLGVVAILGLAGLASSGAGAQDDVPSIKKVMGKLHAKQKGLLPSVKKALQGDSPDWAQIKKATKAIVDLSGTITDLDPPQGEKENYSKLANNYLATAKDLDAAAQAEDAAKAGDALKSLGGTCKTCHQAHQLKK